MNLLNFNLGLIHGWVSKKLNKDSKRFFHLIFTNSIYMGENLSEKNEQSNRR
jgi:hypothetical protein